MEPQSRTPADPWYRLADGGLFLLLATAAFALGCQEMFDADVLVAPAGRTMDPG